MSLSPLKIYHRIEKRLSPLMRDSLSINLPKIGGKDWWSVCVLPALNKIQKDNIRSEQTLNQFDLPALVSIFYYNRRSLKPILGVGDELTNYLFTIKTFRNDVIHKPDLKLDDARSQVIEHSARLAQEILSTNLKSIPSLGRTKRNRYLVFGAIFALLASLGGYWCLQNIKESQLIHDCAKLKAELAAADSYRDVIDSHFAFKDKREDFVARCSSIKGIESVVLTTDELYSISYTVQNRVREYIRTLPKPQVTPDAINEQWLKLTHSILVKQGKIATKNFNEQKDEIVNIIKKFQSQYQLKVTGIPDPYLLNLIEHGSNAKEKGQ